MDGHPPKPTPVSESSDPKANIDIGCMCVYSVY